MSRYTPPSDKIRRPCEMCDRYREAAQELLNTSQEAREIIRWAAVRIEELEAELERLKK